MTEIKKSYTRQIAKALGVEIGERFRIKGHPTIGTFWFVEDNSEGPRDFWEYKLGPEYYDTDIDLLQILKQILAGYYEIEKLPWKPKYHEIYFYFSISNRCVQSRPFYDDETLDMMNFKAGNCFRTKEEAKTKGREIVEQIKKEFEEA